MPNPAEQFLDLTAANAFLDGGAGTPPGMPKVRVPGLNAPTELEEDIEKLPHAAKATAKGLKWLAEGPAAGVPMIANNYVKALGRGRESVDERLGAAGNLVRGAFETMRPAAVAIPGAMAAAPVRTAVELGAGFVAPEVAKKGVELYNKATPSKKYQIGEGGQRLIEEGAGALPFVSMASRLKGKVKPSVTAEAAKANLEPPARQSPLEPSKPTELVLENATDAAVPQVNRQVVNETNKWVVGKKTAPKAKNTQPSVVEEPAPLQAKPAAESAKVFEEKLDPAQEFLRTYGTEENRGNAEISAETFDRVLGARDQQTAAKKAKQSVEVPETGIPEEQARLEDIQDRYSRSAAGKPYEALDEAEKGIVDELIQENRAGSGVREPNTEPSRNWNLPKPKEGRGREIPWNRRKQRGSFTNRPVADAPPEDAINMSRLNLTPDEATQFRSQLQAMEKSGALVNDVEPHESILREMASVGPELVEYMSRVPEEQGLRGRAAVQLIRERMNALTGLIVDGTKKLNDPQNPLTAEETAKLTSDLNKWDANQKEYISKFAGIGTEWGRNLSALRIMANKTLDTGFWATQAKRAKGLPADATLPDADLKRVRELTYAAQQAEASGDPNAVLRAKADLSKAVAEMTESGWRETALAMWKAGLFGVKTHFRNLGGNGIFAVMEEASRVPTALVDMAVANAHTDRRTAAGSSMRGITNALEEAATRGASEAKQIFLNGATASDMAKGDMPRELNFQGLRKLAERSDDELTKKVLIGTNDFINRYVNTHFRTLAAEDKIFRVYAMRRELEAEAKIIALNEARRGVIPETDILKRATELVHNPTQEMGANAAAYGEFATFNNPNIAARATSIGLNYLESIKGKGEFAGKALATGFNTQVPFKNTPANVIARMFDYTPIGFGKSGYALADSFIKGAMNAEQQKMFSESIGRGSIGTALMYLGYLAQKKGMATGMSEERPDKQNIRTAAGLPKGAILVDGKWHRIAGFAPGGSVFAMGATLAAENDRPLKEEAKRPWNLLKVGTKAALEQPFLQGTQETIEALKDPEQRMETFLSSKAGSLVPTLVSDAATVIDPARSEWKPPTSGGPLDPVAYGIKSRLPFLRGTLPKAKDVFGQPLPSSRWNAINPMLSQEDKSSTDPLFKAMVSDDFGVASLRKNEGETDEELRIRKELTGILMLKQLRELELPTDKDERKKEMRSAVTEARRAVSEYVKSDEYKAMPVPQRVDILTKLTESYRPRQ